MHRQTDKILNELFVSDRRVAALGSAEQDLHAFIDAEISGQDAQARFPKVFAEIAGNDDVRRLYSELKDLLLLEGEEEFFVPASHRFNFAYLKAEKTTAANSAANTVVDSIADVVDATVALTEALTETVPWRLNELGRLVIDFSAQFLESLALPAPQLMGVKSTRSQAGKILLDYTLDTAQEDLNVQITARELASDPSLCTITVKVDVPSRGGWPNLGEVLVALTVGDDDPSQEQQTDAFGEVHFENIKVSALPELHFEIDSGSKLA